MSETTQTPLLSHEQSDELSGRWHEIQVSFVDRPQEAVEEADALVSDLMQRITSKLVHGLEFQPCMVRIPFPLPKLQVLFTFYLLL